MIIKFSREIHIGYEEGIEPLVPTVSHGFQCPQCFFLQLQDRGMSPFSDIEICFSRQGITKQHMCIVRKYLQTWTLHGQKPNPECLESINYLTITDWHSVRF
jgi:hypothetical protein